MSSTPVASTSRIVAPTTVPPNSELAREMSAFEAAEAVQEETNRRNLAGLLAQQEDAATAVALLPKKKPSSRRAKNTKEAVVEEWKKRGSAKDRELWAKEPYTVSSNFLASFTN